MTENPPFVKGQKVRVREQEKRRLRRKKLQHLVVTDVRRGGEHWWIATRGRYGQMVDGIAEYFELEPGQRRGFY